VEPAEQLVAIGITGVLEVFFEELIGFGVVALGFELAHLFEVIEAVGGHVEGGGAGPDRFLVEQDFFLGIEAPRHGAEPAVTDGVGSVPRGGGCGVHDHGVGGPCDHEERGERREEEGGKGEVVRAKR
jgi:hypothetical protein